MAVGTVRIATVAAVTGRLTTVSQRRLQNGGGGAIETVGYSSQESNSRTVKTVLGLEQVGRYS